jgi:hypothetical protein
MSKFAVTLKCVRCGKEIKALADGDPEHEHDIAVPPGWQPVVRAAVTTSMAEPCDALCPACRGKKS